MKKLLLLFVLILHLLVMSSATVFAETSPTVPKKIGVLELDNKTIHPQLGKLAAAAMMVHLLKVNSCDIMDQEVLKETFLDQGQSAKGIVDPAIASSIGLKLGLDYIIMGNVVSANSHYQAGYWIKTKAGPQFVQPSYSCSGKFEVMMLDVKSSQIVFHETFTGSSNQTTDLQAAMEDGGYQTARRIYKFIPLLGTITQIEGSNFHINLNEVNGIKKGDLFSPYNPNIIIDGKDKKAGPSVVLKVIEVNETDCVAVLSKGNPNDIKLGTSVSKHFRTEKGMFGNRKTESLKQNSK